MPKPKRENKEDSRLVAQAQADKEAFGDLYRKYFKRVKLYIRRRMGESYESAEDLAQETFLRAFERLSSFRSRGYSYLTYLLRISRNLVVNFYRRHKEDRLSEFASEMLGEADGLEGEIDKAILAGFVKEALGKLPEKDREILRLFYEEELSLRDIAKKEGKSENAVKLRLSRIRKRLGAALSEMTPFSPSGVSTYRRKVGREKR
ncbi:MAG: sigma-70 family RNA polymerase sigma factor [bacterium]|nr:sigma-70 family RNA polymerase sigma factor [bacterium]